MSLPRYPKDLAVIIVKAKGRENTFRDVTVQKRKVHDALVWLINNNPHYSELIINEDALNSLPENGVPPGLMTVDTDDDIVSDDNCSPDVGPPTDNPSEDIVYNDSTEMSSFLPVGEQQQQEIEAVRDQLSENEPMPWLSVENEPLNEYQVSHLATMAFPTLFPDGKGDPTNQGLLRDVPLQERIKHLLKFAEILMVNGYTVLPTTPRFFYWAFNMIQRKRILQQSGIFLKQNPGKAHLTINELREMAASNNANVFMSKVSRYVGNIAGTNAYWNRIGEELKAIITSVGAPTLFFTFSSADMHWPELHALFKADTDNELGDSTSHWFRYEYQSRGSIHCHGTAKLNNDPGLCQLTQTALKGFLAQKFKDENDCSDTTELEQGIEAGDNEHYRAKIVAKRNDSRLNNHQQLQLQGWRANCDSQVVIDHYACVEYLTKYAAKVIKKIVMKSLGARYYALKLHSSSFKVMPVSLNGSCRVHDAASIDEGESCTDYSLLDVYANREQYESSQNIINMNFVQFATTYKVDNNELTKLPENIIPRIFPTYSPNPKGPNFGLYCKYQLLRFKPWRTTQNNAWGDQEPTDEVLINCWHEFFPTPYGQSNVPDWFDKLQAVI
ncbi:Hypothetical predicted protein [Paramuricea clavata]|uniref:Uncharacterized protein n=1 Tax=Paramuricea clavata TaxID=317549 RepID=A0A6S7JFF3_PARCT|nr:Hypothetical predicted protein [Paramuricea clavata]